jgi:transposase InsO family protein
MGIVAKPLTPLLTKKGFLWNDQAQQAFEQLKLTMVNTPVLALPNLDTELQRKAMAKLVGLRFKFQYKRGVENGAADALCRVGHLLSVNAPSVCQPLWMQKVANSYATDSEAQALLARLAVHSPDEDGFELHRGVIRVRGKLWIGANTALQTKLISALHDSAIGGHSGTTATYHRVKKLFSWKGLKSAVENFVRQCSVCQHTKHENFKPAGKLQPLPVPEAPWQDISLDFIEGLPKSDGCDSILVVVDRFTKFAHFIPLRHPFSSSQVAKALWDNVIKLHGVPLTIVSDRDRIFTSHTWREMLQTAGTKLLYSTAYHPQTNGQTERVNQCLEESMLGGINAWRCISAPPSMKLHDGGGDGCRRRNSGTIRVSTLH